MVETHEACLFSIALFSLKYNYRLVILLKHTHTHYKLVSHFDFPKCLVGCIGIHLSSYGTGIRPDAARTNNRSAPQACHPFSRLLRVDPTTASCPDHPCPASFCARTWETRGSPTLPCRNNCAARMLPFFAPYTWTPPPLPPLTTRARFVLHARV